MGIATAGDINLYYEVHGSGEPLVLIMGYGFHSGGWINQVAAFSKEFQVITFDNRGTGRSDKPDPPYTTAMMARDTAGLLDSIGVKDAHIFGLSLGGMIAQHLAANYPSKVKSLVIGSAWCGGSHGIPLNPDGVSALFDIDRIQNMMPAEFGKTMIPWIYSQGFLKFLNDNPALLQQMSAMLMAFPTPIHGYIGQAAAIKAHDTYELLPKIKAPSLVIAGETDRLMPVENSRILASRIPQAELIMLKNAGHGFIADSSEQANKVILDFLLRHSRGK